MHPTEQRIQEELDAAGVVHEWRECDPALADTAAFCDHYGISLDDSANAIVVVGKGDPRQHVVCVALATTRLDVNGVVRKRLGTRKASFAAADETRELTGMEIGGVTPVGLPTGLPVWIDAAVLDRERVVIGGGVRSSKLFLDPRELTKLGHVEVVADLARPVEPAP
ncbi:MAG: YbaK/EbsC family protein [Acidimicrobiales bacterium]